ncbi:MAG: AAA family ATPase [Planctomycetes bacterium]|nr:AAA family ATPase [Planctomycetota bacterium]
MTRRRPQSRGSQRLAAGGHGRAGAAGTRELAADEVRWTCSSVGRSSTAPGPSRLLGQPRAIAALRTGLELYAAGYNVFVSGLMGSGRTSIVRHLLEEMKPSCRLGLDHVFVHNFREPNKPRLISLPRGQADRFRERMAELVGELREALRRSLGSARHRQTRQLMQQELERRRARLLAALRREARKQGFAVVEAEEGGEPRLDLQPLLGDAAQSPAEWEAAVAAGRVSPAKRAKLRRAREALLERIDGLSAFLDRTLRRFQRELQTADRAAADAALQHELAEFLAEWPQPSVAAHVEELRRALVRDLARWAAPDSPPGEESLHEGTARLEDLAVLVVKCARGDACPVIVEPNPTYASLFGTIERVAESSGSELRRIHPGALLRADGGYLVLRWTDIAQEPGVWQHLKRALRSGLLEVREFDPSAGTTAGALQPAPIPLDVKVVMIGEPGAYEQLAQEDPQFPHLFKVHAEFDSTLPNTPENRRRYADFLDWLARSEDVPRFAPDANAAVVEHGARFAGRQDKLTTCFGELADVARESAHFARAAGATLVHRPHVEQALQQRAWRIGLARDRMEQAIAQGYLLIATSGKAMGQVNGLTVVEDGVSRFGKVVRITAATGPAAEGGADLISIEREADLSGPIHDKGVLVLRGFLTAMLGRDRPLALAATLGFEQLYGGLDGDSASCAELFALLSSLADVPLEQGIAVTGSMNQRGEVQAVGGVDEKIEGFYRACRARRLNGKQGVLIPEANARDLMLEPELVDAVARGRFRIWTFSAVLDGLELLTGMLASEVLSRARRRLDGFRRGIEKGRG